MERNERKRIELNTEKKNMILSYQTCWLILLSQTPVQTGLVVRETKRNE